MDANYLSDEKGHVSIEAISSNENVVVQSTYIRPQARKLYDSSVTFEEYYYYAQKTRQEEKGLPKPKSNFREILGSKKNEIDPNEHAAHHHTELNLANKENRLEVTDEEWTNASRAFRTASAGAAFYLITVDIMGPWGIGFSLGTLGWGPGIALYVVFGFMAGYSGYCVWHTFIGIDSYEFPARNYGDLMFRTWGTFARYLTNFLQAIAMLLILGEVTILMGLNISQMSRFKLCYVVCPLLFVVAGLFLTQIRTLKSYGVVANFAVWLNVLAIFLTMGFMAHSPPNHAISVLGSAGSAVDPTTITPDKAGNYPPVIHYTSLPVTDLVGSINGLLTGVFCYAGVQLFVEFLAEMRRPMDFLKAMWGAQLFICVVYLVYGSYVYYWQGQYSFNPSYQGVSKYAWQTVGNAIVLVSGLIAAGLFGNIGIKVFYNNVLMEMLNAPPLITRSGKILYAIIVPIWWSISFIIAIAIPDYFGFVSVVAASMLMNLTYAIPPFAALGFDIQKNAIRSGEGFDPNTGRVIKTDTGVKRWWRGFWSGGTVQVGMNVWHVVYFLCALAMCGLGMYAAVDGMVVVFKNPVLNSFSCVSPLNLAAAAG